MRHLRMLSSPGVIAALAVVATLTSFIGVAAQGNSGGGGKVTVKTDFRTVSTTGASGWIQFCRPNDEGATGDVDPSDKCISIRAFGFSEVDTSGAVVAVNIGNGAKRRILNLHSAMRVSAATSAKMAICGGSDAKEGQACGTADGGGALEFEVVPITVDLASVSASGEIGLTSMIFKNNGTMTFDGKTYPIRRGMTKFDISMRNYVFSATGAKVQFQLRIRNRDRKEADGNVNTNSSGFAIIDSGIICVPRYSVRASAVSAVEWKTASVTRVETDNVVAFQFTFEGPFVEMHYDPFVVSEEIDGTATTSAPSSVGSAANTSPMLLALSSAIVAASSLLV